MLAPIAWGKLSRADSGTETGRLGLLLHCMDVAAVVQALLRLPTIRERMERLAGRPLSGADLQRLIALGVIHDLGKASLGFQSKALTGEQRRALLKKAGGDWSECGHVREIGPLFLDDRLKTRFREVFPIGVIRSWDKGFALLLAAVSHHGTPIRLDDLRSAPRWTWTSASGYDPWQPLETLGTWIQRAFPLAFGVVDDGLPDAPAFVHAFAGLVSLADWIASNPNPGFFPYDLGDEASRWAAASNRAIEVLELMRIDVEPLRTDLRARSIAFSDVFRDEHSRSGFAPTQMQSCMESDALGATVIVEAETGSGKTEAALWRFKTLFEAGEVDALAFVLPTRVSAVQIYVRVERFMQALFPNAALRPNVLLAVPGYLRVDGQDAIECLPHFEVLWPDNDGEGQAHLRWVAENTKRYLAAACAVGTVDQVLLSGLQVRHAHLRGFALLRSLLVVDEVHASDLYMTRILEVVLKRHRAAGGHALLLSATLGVAARAQLLGRGVNVASLLDASARECAPYPCISDQSESREVHANGLGKPVTVTLAPWLRDADAIAAHAAEAVAQGGRVLIVRNTVRGVLAVQQALETRLGADHPALFRCRGVVCPHHGRYAAADRVVLDAAIEMAFGKHAANGPAVLCGSQTLEQSLDIDADLLITDLAPMDVLLQRIGRLHRHIHRCRPAAFAHARVVILVPIDDNLDAFLHNGPDRHGLGGYVYPNLLAIDATWAELANRQLLTLPTDNRILVERCTDPDTLERRASAKGEAWIKHWAEREGVQRSQAQQAAYARLDWSRDWDDVAFPGNEEFIRTRLGAEALRVQLPEPCASPFEQPLNELTVPAWMWHGSSDIRTISIDHCDGHLLVSVNGRKFTYSRLGLGAATE